MMKKNLFLFVVPFLLCFLEEVSCWVSNTMNVPPPRAPHTTRFFPLKSSASSLSLPPPPPASSSSPNDVSYIDENPPSAAIVAPPRSSSSSSSGGRSSSLLQRYENMCKTKPLVTKCVTYAVVSAVGNLLSQAIRSTCKGELLKICVPEVTTFALTGLLYVGPFYHYWYDQLWKIGDWMKTRFGSSNDSQVAAQIVIDQSIGVAVFFPLYFVAFEIFEAFVCWRAPILMAAHARCLETLKPVVLTNWKIWPLANYVNFRSVPQNLRVLATSVMSLAWNALLGVLMS